MSRSCFFAPVTGIPPACRWGSLCPAPTALLSVGVRSCIAPTLPSVTLLAPPSASSFPFCFACASAPSVLSPTGS
eukprot:5242588-Pyramimonas_sp.AAC.1